MRSALGQKANTTKQVLLIEEIGNNLKRIEPLLAPMEQYQLTVCKNHTEAMQIMYASGADIVLLCCSSSPLPCQGMIADLIQCHPDLPIIAIGENISPEHGERLIQANATDYLSTDTLTSDSLLRCLRYAESTQQKNSEIDQLLHRDPLTTVGNRQFFYRALLQKLTQLPHVPRQLALITIDLDEFRKFNTRFGVSSGDQIVQDMCQRIQNSARADEVIARLGSDEFALILDCSPEEDLDIAVNAHINRLISVLKDPYIHGNESSVLNCSIGVALAPEHGIQLDELTRKATIARFSAKQVHGCSYSIFRSSMEEEINNQPDLAADLMNALRGEQFTLHYQPRIDLHSGRIVGAEALIRWNHPSRGLIMPSDFIPTSEKSGLIVPIGYWVIHQAGLHLQTIKTLGLHIDRLGVNLSFRQFRDDHLVSTIRRIITQNQIDTSVLEFELTESAIFNDEEHVRECLDALSEDGITFSLDDFGTGYSSFALLHKLPISALKIDRSFVSHVNDSNEAAEIVRSIISLAQNMKMKVIAEGVETREQLDFLINHQCDQIQGYYYSPPVSFEDFIRMLSTN
ncbi:GGDEF domain-containing response regulator [Neptuniibacter sp.]|uniref:GGDEF domain-containing response regulator n=1 Tax=Neptuniibacter sp. TaxID=1962643 RepID=UPI0026092BDB|nr:GGDEF domain-containing response regulator [Neptuniibacter sp.]MCP4596152.1 GGDEF domain-containing response regulator [Neptuniibacter sp.]